MITVDDRVLREAVTLRNSEFLRHLRECRADVLERLAKAKHDADFRTLQGEARTYESLIQMILESRETLEKRGVVPVDMNKAF